MVSYEGIFFETETVDLIHSLERDRLPVVNDEIHCTFKYHPTSEEIFNELVGRSFDVYLVGYGCDGQNSGFEVLLPEELQEFYINFEEEGTGVLKKPHITASLGEGATAVNKKRLDFKPLEKPVRIEGRFGFWIKEENGEYLSYEPYVKGKTK